MIIAKVAREVTLSGGCIIGAKCELLTKEALVENTVIFGSENRRRIANEKPQDYQQLSKLLPGFQKFKKKNAN
jgi:dynactin-6